MKNDNISELNKMLKGEYMAIDKYDHYIKGMQDNSVKSEMQKIQQLHKQQATNISTRVQQLGGNPINTSGIAGFISEITSNIRNEKDTQTIIKSAIEGEKMGVDATTRILNNITDEESKNLINGVMTENKNAISTLSNLMNN
ncbi:ferritin-like domain-containing protein [Clostridium lundense]|uniref:ferritin-like domain-containing protein n=1 Tax=Clostridium lundense TaxID=319475 RepID=UPI0006869ED8|nr:ferritin-like domain-containing protein [Clostridium lundense]